MFRKFRCLGTTGMGVNYFHKAYAQRIRSSDGRFEAFHVSVYVSFRAKPVRTEQLRACQVALSFGRPSGCKLCWG